MLTFKKKGDARPIAVIDGGEYNGKTVYISMDATKTNITVDPIDDLNTVLKCIKEETPPKTKNLKEIYNLAILELRGLKGKEIKLISGKVLVVPNPKTRDVGYISGPSGSGKSTWIGNYMEVYKKQHPDNDIFVFSKVGSDEAFDDLDPTRIEINEELVEDPITPNELNNSLVVFDDVDTLSDKKIKGAVQHLRNDLLQIGRHDNVYVLNTSHQLMNYSETRTQLSESHFVVFFPNAGSGYHIERFLKVYVGVSKEVKDKIMSLPSRWVMVYMHAPRYVVYESGIFLI